MTSDAMNRTELTRRDWLTYTKEYAFDSQNVSFWSGSEQRYVCYFRHFLDKRLRSVCRTSSSDFVKWSEPVALKPNFPGEHSSCSAPMVSPRFTPAPTEPKWSPGPCDSRAGNWG